MKSSKFIWQEDDFEVISTSEPKQTDLTPVPKKKMIISVKGSATSGNRMHAGRPGKVGGSMPKSSAGIADINTILSDLPEGFLHLPLSTNKVDAYIDVGKKTRAHVSLEAVPDQSGYSDNIRGKYLVDATDYKGDSVGNVAIYDNYADAKLDASERRQAIIDGVKPTKPTTKPKVESPPESSLETVQTHDQIKGSKLGRGYFITPDGSLVDISKDFGHGTNDHVGFIVAMDHPQALGVDKQVADKLKAASDKLYGRDYDQLNDKYQGQYDRAYGNLWDSVRKAGLVRVRVFGNEVAIDGMKVDNKLPGRVQDLVFSNKLPGDKNTKYTVENPYLSSASSYISFDYSTLVGAGRLSDLTSEFKEKKMKIRAGYKGGSGSGNWRHEGRPGKEGGSLPTGVAASSAAGTANKPAATTSIQSSNAIALPRISIPVGTLPEHDKNDIDGKMAYQAWYASAQTKPNLADALAMRRYFADRASAAGEVASAAGAQQREESRKKRAEEAANAPKILTPAQKKAEESAKKKAATTAASAAKKAASAAESAKKKAASEAAKKAKAEEAAAKKAATAAKKTTAPKAPKAPSTSAADAAAKREATAAKKIADAEAKLKTKLDSQTKVAESVGMSAEGFSMFRDAVATLKSGGKLDSSIVGALTGAGLLKGSGDSVTVPPAALALLNAITSADAIKAKAALVKLGGTKEIGLVRVRKATRFIIDTKGSATSGNRMHAGRPGKVGGSAPKSNATITTMPASVQTIHTSTTNLPKGAKKVMVGFDKNVEAYVVKGTYTDYTGKPQPRTDVYDNSGVLKGHVKKVEKMLPQHSTGSFGYTAGYKKNVTYECYKPGEMQKFDKTSWYDKAIQIVMEQ